MKSSRNFLFIFLLILPFTLFPWISKFLYNFLLPPISSFTQSNQDVANEALLDATHLIQLYGYPAENHSVITDDGFLITLHRIPSRKQNKTNSGIPIYLQHGAFVCSSNWIDNGKESWGFLLADEGYDVWMGNFRYNSYTQNLKEDDHNGKHIGWDILSKYEVPTTVDYIINVTGHQQILVIGHSMGAVAVFASLIEIDDFSNKIKGFIALAPVSNYKYSSSVYFKSINFVEANFPMLYHYFHTESNLPLKSVRRDFILRLCPADQSFICRIIMDMMIGYNPFSSLNNTRIPIYSIHNTDNYPDHTMAHWIQGTKTPNKMTAYDYGKEKNIDLYNQITPREYDLKKIKIPVGIMYGINDAMANVIDIEIISRQLSRLVYKHLIPKDLVSHLDFFYDKPKQLVKQLLPVLSSMWFYE